MQNRFLAATAIATLLTGVACTVNKQSIPSLTGPSEQAISLRMRATPDRLTADGTQTSRVEVTAFDAGGRPIAVTVHLDALATVGSATQSFGTLSASTITTGVDAGNPTFVTFGPPVSTTSGANVTIFGSIIASNAAATTGQQVGITVAPAATVSANAPTPVINLTPSVLTYGVAQAITFDATASCGSQLVAGACPGGIAIASEVWNFGDGSSSSGGITAHAYASAGTYTVTLFVTNALGITSSISRSVVVAAISAPTVSYTVSPTTIKVTAGNPNAFFNAAASAVASGHTIVRYDWNFGDNSSTSTTTATTSHFYSTANIFKTTLTVTDDLGKSTTGSLDVAVVAGP
jgi:hypothetical protein